MDFVSQAQQMLSGDARLGRALKIQFLLCCVNRQLERGPCHSPAEGRAADCLYWAPVNLQESLVLKAHTLRNLPSHGSSVLGGTH